MVSGPADLVWDLQTQKDPGQPPASLFYSHRGEVKGENDPGRGLAAGVSLDSSRLLWR